MILGADVICSVALHIPAAKFAAEVRIRYRFRDQAASDPTSEAPLPENLSPARELQHLGNDDPRARRCPNWDYGCATAGS